MKAIPNKTYTVVKRIKIHTKPLVEIEVPQTGVFVKETASHLVFRGFRVRKHCVVSIEQKEVGADD